MEHVLHVALTLLAVLSARPVVSSSFSNSSFVERCEAECSLQKDFMSCGKYRVVRWLRDVNEKEFSYGPVRILRLASMPYQAILPRLPQTRAFKSSAIETLTYIRDTLEDFLLKRVVVYTIDNPSSARSFGSGPIMVDDDELEDLRKEPQPNGDWRIFKKKKSMIIPLLILLNLIKVKLLLLPIFLGVHFIKKALVFAGLIVPSILSHLKVCKVPPQQNPQYHVWASAGEAPQDYPTGYDQEETNWLHRNDPPAHFVYPAYQAYRNPYG